MKIFVFSQTRNDFGILLKLQSFHDFPVRAEEHKYHNSFKGVIYRNDLRNINEDEILEELKAQNDVKVGKILKKRQQ